MPRTQTLTGRAAWWLALGTLVLLPYESWLPVLPVGRFTITALEAVWMAAVATWLVSLAVARRRPHFSRGLVLGFVLLLAVGLASALLADGFNSDALVFVGRSAAGWLLCLAVIDQVRDGASLHAALAAIVFGAAVSALVGLVLIAIPSAADALGVKQFFAAGAPRLDGTFDYPNTAAMAFEASALLGLGLIALEQRRRMRWLEIGAVAVIVAAMLLTLSRGAVVGAAIGLAVVVLLAAWSRRPRVARVTALAAVAFVAVALVVEISVAPIQRLFTDAESGLFGAQYLAPAAAHIDRGNATVTVAVTNTGSLGWNSGDGHLYQLGYHWLTPGTADSIADGQEMVELGPVAPGQTATVSITVAAPASVTDSEVGWDVVRDGWAWFSTRGVPVVTTALGTDVTDTSTASVSTVVLFGDQVGPTRGDLWTAAAQMISDRPLLGVGPGTYRLRYNSYASLPTATETHANNTYLEIGATTGLLGLLAFLGVVGVAIAPLVVVLSRRPSQTDDETPLPTRAWVALAAILGAAAAFLGHGLLDYFLSFNPTGGLWWATLGLAAAAAAPAVVRSLADDASDRT